VKGANGNEFGGLCIFVECANIRGDLVDATLIGWRWLCCFEHRNDIINQAGGWHIESQQENEKLGRWYYVSSLFFFLKECFKSFDTPSYPSYIIWFDIQNDFHISYFHTRCSHVVYNYLMTLTNYHMYIVIGEKVVMRTMHNICKI